jgi:DNA-binding transcriptional MerR regulator
MGKKGTAQANLTIINRNLPRGRDLGKRRYTVSEVMRLAGVSRKQVTHWAKTKLLSPSFRNSKARGGKPSSFYSATEVVMALIFSDMKHRGFSLQQIRKVADNLSKDGVRLDEPDTYLLTDGYSVYYANSDDEVVDFLKHHRQMMLVPIREQVEKLKKVA